MSIRYTPPKSHAESQFYGAIRNLESETNPEEGLMLLGAALMMAKYLTLCGWSSPEDDEIHYKEIDRAIRYHHEAMEDEKK